MFLFLKLIIFKWNKEELFKYFVSKNDVKNLIRFMSKYNVDPSMSDNWALLHSAKCNYIEMADFLLKDERVIPEAEDNWAFALAAKKNNIAIMELLMEYLVPLEDNNWILSDAAEDGFIDVVRLLLESKLVIPWANCNYAIELAFHNNFLDIVEVLWGVEGIKKTLPNDNKALYNKISLIMLKRKISKFN